MYDFSVKILALNKKNAKNQKTSLKDLNYLNFTDNENIREEMAKAEIVIIYCGEDIKIIKTRIDIEFKHL